MTNTATHHAFCFTLFALVGLAFLFAFTSSLASSQSLWDHKPGTRVTVFTPSQEQANPVTQLQAPSTNQPCPAEPALIQVAI